MVSLTEKIVAEMTATLARYNVPSNVIRGMADRVEALFTPVKPWRVKYVDRSNANEREQGGTIVSNSGVAATTVYAETEQQAFARFFDDDTHTGKIILTIEPGV